MSGQQILGAFEESKGVQLVVEQGVRVGDVDALEGAEVGRFAIKLADESLVSHGTAQVLDGLDLFLQGL